MKKNVLPLLTALMLMLLAGCNASSDYDYSPTGECIVTGATLGTLKRTITAVNAAGRDTTYTVNVTGALYPLSIDQLNNHICNLDSLPEGTDVAHVVFSAFNCSATKTIRSLTTGEDTIFVTSDSTDFSQVREVTTYATDGVSRRTYTVEIRVHQEPGDSTRWLRLASSDELAALQQRRLIEKDSVLYLFATDGITPLLLSADLAQPAAWEKTAIGVPHFDTHSVVMQGGRFYALADGRVLTSTDGKSWEATREQPAASTLLALIAGTKTLAVLAAGSLYSTQDGGATAWTEDETDESNQLPTSDIAAIRIGSISNPDFEDLMLVGKCEGEPVVWKRSIDLKSTEAYAWLRITGSGEADKACPTLAGYSLLPYDNGALLTGEGSDGRMADFYTSQDKGRTWTAGVVKKPAAEGSRLTAAVDKDNFIYLLAGGELWRGRLNRLGWREVVTSYRKTTTD